MSVFDIDQNGQQALSEDARLNPISSNQVTPGAFTGTAKGIGMGVMKGGARVGQFIGLAGAVVPMAIDKITDGDNFSGKSLTERYFKGMDETVNRAADYWTPSHSEVGKVGQVLGGLSEVIPPLLASGGNPAVAATLVAGSQTAGTGIDLVKQGVDGKTAGTVAAIQGLSAYAGFKIPFLGNTLATRMGSGVAGNLVTNAGGAAAQSKLLKGSGYDEQAKQFDPLNGEARAIDVLTGMAFGGFAHLASGRAQLKPTEVDAVLTANNAKHFQEDTAPGTPVDARSSSAHQTALESAVDQMVRGDRVNISDAITDAQFIRRPESAVGDAIREAYRSDLPPGARWAPSERLTQMDVSARRALRFDDVTLNEYAASIEQRYGLPGGLLNAIKNSGEKSGSASVSPKGASGVMQFMPENLKKYGVTDATDPAQMIDAAGRYLRDTLQQYGSNVDAVIADYNGGPRQARRVMNGEAPKAAETQAYLARVKEYLGRTDIPQKQPSADEFASRVDRVAEYDQAKKPTFRDGTAYTKDEILPFYDSVISSRAPDIPVPDVLFRVGQVDDITARGLHDFLPGFNDNLREARISGESIAHIQDSRPAIARDILQKLDDGVLYADEVLPNPQDRSRALVVLRDAAPTSSAKGKHTSSVLEVSANGKGIDVVTVMSSRDGALKKARQLRDELAANKGEGASTGGATYPSSSLASRQAGKPHAAADFPTFDQGNTSIAQATEGANQRSATVEQETARQISERAPDMRITLDDGTEISAREAMQLAAEDMQQADTDRHAFMAAITCFLRNR